MERATQQLGIFLRFLAWELDKRQNQYYYHRQEWLTDPIGNPKVVAEIQNVFSFWLDLGNDFAWM
jgi:hypothetical protein